MDDPDDAALRQLASDLLVAYVSGDDVLQAVTEDHPLATPAEVLVLRDQVMTLVRTATVTVTWPAASPSVPP